MNPASGYKYVSNTCGGTVSGNTMTISNVTANKTCTVTFGEPPLLVDKILSDNTVQSDSGIDFSQKSSDTNGKGLYYTSTNTENNQRTYYFRGAVTNNYVRFAGYYWKIVRINEDGSIRIIYNGTSGTGTGEDTVIGTSAFNTNYDDNAYEGYMYGTARSSTYEAAHANTNNSTIKTVIDNWYNSNLSSYSSYLSDAGFCNDRSIYSGPGYNEEYDEGETFYGAYNRLDNNKTPQFACPNASNDLFTTSTSSKGNKALTNPIGLITADEVWYAGATTSSNNTYYLYTGADYWTMTPWIFEGLDADVWYVYDDGQLSQTNVNYQIGGVRPVINIKSTVRLSSTIPSGCSSQNGTASCPYVIG